MNTKVCYLYRDASNYKVYNEAIVNGALTPEMTAEIFSCCATGEHYFIPSEVGLPEKRFDSWSRDDTEWFELEEIVSTEEMPDTDLNAEDLLHHFRCARQKWGELWW